VIPNHQKTGGIVMDKSVEEFMVKVKEKNPGEKEFHQAVQEVVESLMPYIQKTLSIKRRRF
jgi:hypothetical protein